MTEPDEAAMKAAERLHLEMLGRPMTQAIKTIARALMAEREKAAQIAINHMPATQDCESDKYADFCETIAAAIRKGEHHDAA